jgi:hypothetical protein
VRSALVEVQLVLAENSAKMSLVDGWLDAEIIQVRSGGWR